MSKPLRNLLQVIYKKFKLIWVLITLIFLFAGLYINWNISLNRSYKDIAEIATNLSNNVDGFIEDLFQDIYTLPVYGKEFSDCKTTLYPYLEHIILNNPKISGITISDNVNQLVCSTLPNNEGFLATTTKARSILGPFKLPLFDQPVYLVQQQMGNYHIGILVVASVLEGILRTSKEKSSAISLHNEFERKNILSIEPNPKGNIWIFTPNMEKNSPVNSTNMFSVDKLQSIEGVIVVVFENHQTVLSNLWYSEILVGLLILVISYFLYLLVKNLISRHYSLQGALKQAIKNQEFYPEYQPLLNVKMQCFSGVEVLLRWKDNQNQIIMPDYFVCEAETSGLIVPITLQIITIAFEDTQKILKSRPYFHLAFNLSALHFKDHSFFSKFNQLVKQYEIHPSQILFEITERDLMDKNDVVFSEKMQKLRKEGYSLAVDDYGTGHASISYLQHFPFNYLKIDKLFIQAIGTKAITESLNEAIIIMAQELNLHIIAEGVETKEQVDYLSEHGVTLLQGWYFSKSLPIEKLKALLKGETK